MRLPRKSRSSRRGQRQLYTVTHTAHATPATSATGDAELGALLGEMADLLGANAAMLVEEYAAPHLDREYLEGGRWRTRPAARALLPEGQVELTLENAAIFDVQAEDRAAANAAAEEAAQSETASDEAGDTQEAAAEGTQEAANE